ncbi:TPM domain-containing protein [Taibaiella koreensis]|uniref:TPM domain-containing protein n=1 Tax=Taibaiella koreensis TaxID=1268548 RepID=UPI000E5A030B|nr:TPM domain-containing protein [Taibaiella koreensis]
MKRKYHIIILLATCLQYSACGQVTSSSPPAQDSVRTSTIVEPEGYINDFESLFSEVEAVELDSLIVDFQQRTTNQIAIATLGPSQCSKEDFEDYSLRLANTWGVGQKEKNNGILIAISKAFRQIRIHNGKGIETILSGEETRQIVDDYFIPEFKEGNYFEGTKKGLLALIKRLEEKQNKQ